jgi:exodeoxyribonuclease VIII
MNLDKLPAMFGGDELSNEAYHSGPGISKSQLDYIAKEPALLHWSRNAPRDTEAKTAVDLGDALHAMLLEPDRFHEEYCCDFAPPADALVTTDQLKAHLDKIGADYKKTGTKAVLEAACLEADPDAPIASVLRKRWEESVGKRHIFTAEEWRKLHLMQASVMAHPTAKALLEDDSGINEASLYWRDAETGVLCRCRPDRMVPRYKMVLDVKSTADIDKFERSLMDYRYHVQAPFYNAGYEAYFGEPPRAFVFLVVSSSRSAGRYPVRLVSLHPDDYAQGLDEMRGNLETYAEAERSGIWSGIGTVRLPRFARRETTTR